MLGSLLMVADDDQEIGPNRDTGGVTSVARIDMDRPNIAAARHQKAFIEEVGACIRDGRIKYGEAVTEGRENAPRAFVGLLRGENFGKKLVKVSEDPTRN